MVDVHGPDHAEFDFVRVVLGDDAHEIPVFGIEGPAGIYPENVFKGIHRFAQSFFRLVFKVVRQRWVKIQNIRMIE